MANLIDRFVSWLYITRLWGPRCSDYEPECPCCEQWKAHDELFGDTHMIDQPGSGTETIGIEGVVLALGDGGTVFIRGDDIV